MESAIGVVFFCRLRLGSEMGWTPGRPIWGFAETRRGRRLTDDAFDLISRARAGG